MLNYIEFIANCYFWLFIVFNVLIIMFLFSDDYEQSKRNAIRKGTWGRFGSGARLITIIEWILFFLSIKLS